MVNLPGTNTLGKTDLSPCLPNSRQLKAVPLLGWSLWSFPPPLFHSGSLNGLICADLALVTTDFLSLQMIRKTMNTLFITVFFFLVPAYLWPLQSFQPSSVVFLESCWVGGWYRYPTCGCTHRRNLILKSRFLREKS